MKKIEAIVKPHRIEEVKTALHAVGVTGMTAYEVRGFGRQNGHTEFYRGSEYTVDFVPKIKLEMVVSDELAPVVEQAIIDSAATGSIGDGKVFTFECLGAARVRTGERGDVAL